MINANIHSHVHACYIHTGGDRMSNKITYIPACMHKINKNTRTYPEVWPSIHRESCTHTSAHWVRGYNNGYTHWVREQKNTHIPCNPARAWRKQIFLWNSLPAHHLFQSVTHANKRPKEEWIRSINPTTIALHHREFVCGTPCYFIISSSLRHTHTGVRACTHTHKWITYWSERVQ